MCCAVLHKRYIVYGIEYRTILNAFYLALINTKDTFFSKVPVPLNRKQSYDCLSNHKIIDKTANAFIKCFPSYCDRKRSGTGT